MTGADDYARSMLTRSGTDRLPAHLETAYGIEVASTTELDLGVFKIGRRDGPAWVARVFPRGRPAGAAVGDAAILDFLATSGFPAERPAAPNPVSVLDHQDVLVTGYVEAVPGNSRAEAVRRLGGQRLLGAMLAGLHRLPDARGAFCTGRKSAADAAQSIADIRGQAAAITARAHEAFRAAH